MTPDRRSNPCPFFSDSGRVVLFFSLDKMLSHALLKVLNVAGGVAVFYFLVIK